MKIETLTHTKLTKYRKIKEDEYKESLSPRIREIYSTKWATRFSQYFSSPEDKIRLYAYFNIEEDTPYFEEDYYQNKRSAWNRIGDKLTLIVRKTIMHHYKHFKIDTHLKREALTFMEFDRLSRLCKEEIESYYLVTSTKDEEMKYPPFNFLRIEERVSPSTYLIPHGKKKRTAYLLDYDNLVLTKYPHSPKQYFLKDILSIVIKDIRKENTSWDKINYETFFLDKEEYRLENTVRTLSVMKKITEEQLFYRKRKESVGNLLNRETIKSFYALFAKSNFKPYLSYMSYMDSLYDETNGSRLEKRFYAFLKTEGMVNNYFFSGLLTKENGYVWGTEGNTRVKDGFFSQLLEQYRRYSIGFLPSNEIPNGILSLEGNVIEKSNDLSIEHLVIHSDIEAYKKHMVKMIKHTFKERDEVYSLRIINAKKYANKTKLLLKNTFLDIQIMEYLNANMSANIKVKKLGEWLGNTLCPLFDITLRLGLTESVLRHFIGKYITLGNYLETKDNTVGRWLICDYELLHNAIAMIEQYLDFLKGVEKVTLSLRTRKQQRDFINFVRSVMAIFVRFNADGSSIESVSKELSSLKENMGVLKKMAIQEILLPITKLKDIDTFIMAHEERKYTKLKKKISRTLGINENDESYDIARDMRIYTQHLGLLERIISRENRLSLEEFKKNNLAKGYSVLSENKRYMVEISAHNDFIGLLGTGVRGVCIPHNGEFRLSQLTPDFMNLIIRDRKKVLLWGLLCRAKDTDGNVFYVLNNLQGGINDKRIDAHNVIEDIYTVFDNFCIENKVKSILYMEHGFNALSLKGEYLKEGAKGYYIYLTSVFKKDKKMRLDFYLSEEEGMYGKIDMKEFKSYNNYG